MIVAVTGTPGTGKSKACSFIKDMPVIDLNQLIKDNAVFFGYDEERNSIDVSPARLKKLLPEISKTTVIEGHLSHHLSPDLTIVLRCSPNILGKRLKARGWNEDKIRENQEAEAVDVVLIEALKRKKSSVYEIDTTDMKPQEVAKAIREIIKGRRAKYRPGKIDWSEEVLSWY